MRLGIQLLNIGATLNSFQQKSVVEIAQGETVDLMFQLVDKDQGLRYIPASGSTVYVEIARFPEAISQITNQRLTVDYSVRRNATSAFPSDDKSIWKLPLTAVDTGNMMSSNIRVTVTEGTKISIALLPQAIKIIPKE
jgi:hypothetical protein